MSMQLPFAQGVLRPLVLRDAAPLAGAANDHGVWLNLRDAFPHPYTADDARGFIQYIASQPEPEALAIDVDGVICGVIGATRGTDIQAVGAEVGYWLGRVWWGRGIASAALAVYRDWVMRQWQLTRLFALPFTDNTASCRVLEKCDFVCEGVMRASACKAGVIKDQALYAFIARTN